MQARIAQALVVASLALPLGAAAASGEASSPKAGKPNQKQLERGKYLVKIAGCNDCHTPGYAMAGGKVPESQWLIGDSLGWKGPWGTTYPINLRLYMRDISEEKWVKSAKTMQTRPPMPWFALNDMSEQDLRAIYHYVKALGPAGQMAPAFVPPGKEPQGPAIQFPAK